MIKAANIKNLRFALGVRQVDMAKFLGISSPLLNLIESSQRSVPPEVDKRIAWSEKVIQEADKTFDKAANKQTLSNQNSIRFAWKALSQKKMDLENAELAYAILLRENVEFSRKVYLLQKLRPTSGINSKQLSIYEAWKKYMVRKAEIKLESAGPEVILRMEMKIAAIRAEIDCIEKHLTLKLANRKQPGKKGSAVKN